jgi:hypothetical protein
MSDIATRMDPRQEYHAAARRAGRWVSAGTDRPRVFWDRAAVELAITLTGRALVNLGARAGQLVAISPEATFGDTGVMQSAVEAIEAEGVVLADPLELAAWPAEVWVTDSRTAMAAAWPTTLEAVMVLGDALWSPEWVSRLQRKSPRPPRIGGFYAVPGIPGPLAITCARGRWHFTRDGWDIRFVASDGARAADVGEEAEVVAVPGAEGASPISTGHMVETGSCDCGMEGPAAMRILGPAHPPTLAGRPIHLADVARALWRTPGFGGTADIALTHDRGRGKAYLVVEAGVESGQDVERVKEALNYSLTAALGVPVRVLAHVAETPGRITLVDRRDLGA